MQELSSRNRFCHYHYQVLSAFKYNLIGKTVSILLPGPIENGKIIGSDFNILPSLKASDKGIFNPIKHVANYYCSDSSNKVSEVP